VKLIESIEDYLRYLQHEQGAAKTTYKSYHAYLLHFYQWLQANGYPDPTLDEFTGATIRRYFYHVSNKGLRPRSVYGYMIPLRSYGEFLVSQRILSENPATVVRLPNKDAAIRREASEEEIAALLAAVDRQRNRQRAIFQKAVLRACPKTRYIQSI